MIQKIASPTRIQVPGDKVLEEYIGRVNSEIATLSVAHMVSPPGWSEPYQTPEFDEVTIVLRGKLRVEHEGGTTDIGANETLLAAAGERVRYSNPFERRERILGHLRARVQHRYGAPGVTPPTCLTESDEGLLLHEDERTGCIGKFSGERIVRILGFIAPGACAEIEIQLPISVRISGSHVIRHDPQDVIPEP